MAFSRRTCSLLAIILGIFAGLLPVTVSAQTGSSDTPTDEPQRFTVSADGATLSSGGESTLSLVLRGVQGPVGLAYDSPAGQRRSREFLREFQQRWPSRQFDTNPPQAVLVVAGSKQSSYRLQLRSLPLWSAIAKTLTIRVVVAGAGRLPAALRAYDDAVAPRAVTVNGPVSLQVAGFPLASAKPSRADRVSGFFNEWGTALGLLFMIALVALLWRSLKIVPRTAPKTIKPDARSSVTWDDVAGADDAKEELMEVVQFLRDPKKFTRYGAQMPKGVLLHGPPGTGKTLLAKAVAHESGAHFFSQSAAAFVEMFAGLGAARIRRLFAEARKHAPAIIFIDELDAVGGKRGVGMDNPEREQTLNQLLVEMDGFAGSENVVVMAASNLLEKLDGALLRPGRFDRQVFVSPPDVAGRREILRVHTLTKPIHDVDLGTIAAQTSGLTGADLANLCNEAAIFSARRDGVAITQADFDMALERVIAGVQSKRVLQPAEKHVVAFHEAGHALCAELLPSVDPVHKISIVPRGKALGFTLNLPEEDRYLKTRDELLDHMAMLLGGRMAEQIVFGNMTTGAVDDLRRVSELTHAMVHEYAMGTADSAQRALVETGQASDVTRRIRDEEQRELAYEAQAMAKRLILSHRPQLDALAQALLDHEVLERPQIDAIMAGIAPMKDRPRMTGLPTIAAAQALSPDDPVA